MFASADMFVTVSGRRKRSIAIAMLFVWVFALLSGVANACLTEPRGMPRHELETLPHEHDGSEQAQTRTLVHLPTAPAAASAHRPTHHEHPDRAPCLKSCDESSHTLLKQPSRDTLDLKFVTVSTRAWGEVLVRAPVNSVRASVSTAHLLSPPPRVQFSRLTL